jgi:hypothetical protein
MNHYDSCYDPDNSYEDDMSDLNYDDYNDFCQDDIPPAPPEDGFWNDDYDDSMDGDHESGLASCGWGTDEDYGDYRDDIDAFNDYYGEDF